MKIIGVIPARYKSSRFPGKPLADICGYPMIWWVYQQCKRFKILKRFMLQQMINVFLMCVNLLALK